MPNIFKEYKEYNAAYELAVQRAEAQAGGALSRYDFTRDLRGAVTRANTLDGAHTYTYDGLQRLLTATHPPDQQPTNPDETYTYDQNDNRATSVSSRPDWNIPLAQTALTAPVPVDYLYDAASQLTEDSQYNYTYDPNGNLTRKVRKADNAVWDYTYDPEDRLISVLRAFAPLRDQFSNPAATGTATPSLIVTYSYDPEGRRTSKTVNGITTTYAYDAFNLIAEYDATGTLLARYIHRPDILDHPVAMQRGGQTFYYVYDGQGSVIALTNAQGQIVQKYEYDTFGRPTLAMGQLANPITYTGREYDLETGLYFLRARVYDPDTGRFLQQDPLFTLNQYAYVGNDPMNYSDPLGLSRGALLGNSSIGGHAYLAGNPAKNKKRPKPYRPKKNNPNTFGMLGYDAFRKLWPWNKGDEKCDLGWRLCMRWAAKSEGWGTSHIMYITNRPTKSECRKRMNEYMKTCGADPRYNSWHWICGSGSCTSQCTGECFGPGCDGTKNDKQCTPTIPEREEKELPHTLVCKLHDEYSSDQWVSYKASRHCIGSTNVAHYNGDTYLICSSYLDEADAACDISKPGFEKCFLGCTLLGQNPPKTDVGPNNIINTTVYPGIATELVADTKLVPIGKTVSNFSWGLTGLSMYNCAKACEQYPPSW